MTASKNIVWTISHLSLHFKSCYLKLLISQSKFSGTRKFTLRYQQFEIGFDSEVSRIDCNSQFNRASSSEGANRESQNCFPLVIMAEKT